MYSVDGISINQKVNTPDIGDCMYMCVKAWG